jgi:hypothetical protein
MPRTITLELSDNAYKSLSEYAITQDETIEKVMGRILNNAMLVFVAGQLSGIDKVESALKTKAVSKVV